MKMTAAGIFLMMAASPTVAKQLPSLVPTGWTQEHADPETKTRRFVSPDGRAWLQTRQTDVNRSEVAQELDDIAYRGDEIITYQKRGQGWIAVSGYWGDHIFYRKSNVACGGRRWNHIEFGYPREYKRKMDAAVTQVAHGMTAYSNDCAK